MAQSNAKVIKGVVDSTPLIALSTVECLTLLKDLFDRVFVPVSVYEEVVLEGQERPGSQEVAEADWLILKKPKASFPLPTELLGLDPGEMDVILLAQEIGADWVLIDEKLARKIAKAVGLQVKGTLGVLLTAYQMDLFSREKAVEAVRKLARSPVRISPRLVQWFEEQLG